jgi:D-apionolactonase
MTANPSMAVRLFGTDEPVEPPQLLRAGKLSAELEAGNLRYIRYDGVELIRAISYIVRDRNWGTYNPEITNLEVTGDDKQFRVTYDAEVGDADQTYRYSAEITGEAGGRLIFKGVGEALTDFVTNRTGFVVLHAVEGVAGRPASVEHVDGRTVDGAFPELIDPLQPLIDLRAITHEPVAGLKVRCLMEGDIFEMEDQRNWTDASYKTYVRPLAEPWPYTLAKGTRLDQQVTITAEGAPAAGAGSAGGRVEVTIGERTGTVPTLGFGLEPELADATAKAVDLLREAEPARLVCHYDPRQGHGLADLKKAAQLSQALGAEPWLEAVVASIDGFEAELEHLGRDVAELGSPFPVVLLSPAPDLKCTLPGSPWPPCPPLEAVYAAGRKAFPKARIGGGMFSYFTEFNRKRPPLEPLDLVTFTTSALMHAGDDRSVMEGLESLPFMAKSVSALVGNTPVHVGPSAMGMRANPYGEAPMANPDNIRQAMNRMDPRQRGLLGAAWHLGYFAHFARGGADWITLGGGVGEFGLVHVPTDYAQPWYDEAGGVYPAFHVFRGLARLGGAPLVDVTCAPAREVQALAADTPQGRELWLANLMGEARDLALPGGLTGAMSILDADSFTEASAQPDFMDHATRTLDGDRISLSPYAVVRLVQPKA